MQRLQAILAANRRGRRAGIYAVCSAHPLVLEAALLQGARDRTPVLIEATASQVNQYGGYTGMKPADFRVFVEDIAADMGYPPKDVILGGDHLGPVCWRDEPPESAMDKAAELVTDYVAAGFRKIHLDTSMPCDGDPPAPGDELVARRAASLCETAEQAARATFGKSELAYVIGTEVPPPGGATGAAAMLEVTSCDAVRRTVAAHRDAFLERGLNAAWSRVIGLVAQPGVEFDHASVRDYAPAEAAALKALMEEEFPGLVYEAHSTDYQPPETYAHLVRDRFAILKVGPQLTFALREALFALAHIEGELIDAAEISRLPAVCEDLMLREPEHWEKYYPRDAGIGRLYRLYGYSDRIRYYWTRPRIRAAVDKLLENLTAVDLPMPLLSQYMPLQYAAVRTGQLQPVPRQLVRHAVMRILARYATACHASTQPH